MVNRARQIGGAVASVEVGERVAEATRPLHPNEEGYIERDGVRVHYEVYGEGDPTVLLLPTWTLLHSRVWKAQIPYLGRRFRVVSFDPRGNGRSDRPLDRKLYAESEFAADALAVMDATGTEQAVLASLSHGAQRALLLAAEHPERVLAAAFVAPFFPASPIGGLRWRLMGDPRVLALFLRRLPLARGWLKFNAVHWLSDYEDFLEWFIGRRMFNAPHSTKQIEDAIGWARDTDGATMIASTLGPEAAPLTRRDQTALARSTRCPLLVISAPKDKITAHADARALARVTGGELMSVTDGSHCPQARKPAVVNLALRDLIERNSARQDPTAHRPNAHPRALFVSSPIGLGHAQRDVAIARELRALKPDLEIHWLAQDPVTRVLAAEGETIHPQSVHLASESGHFQSESSGHDLHCFQAFRRMDEILVANFMLFHDVVSEEHYDLWIGDEAWELDHFLHEHPELKRAPFAWLTDFVGFLPMADGGEHEAYLTADYNAEMVEHVADHPDVRDRAIFIGDPEDIVDRRLGPDLPAIRTWTEQHFDFASYISEFDPNELGEREALRAELGYASDEQVCIATVGGSGIGQALLRRVIDAYPQAKRRVPGLRMVVVAGPRIDPDTLPFLDGLEIHPYVHNLYRHLAACDLAITQGGLATTMELTASRRPFIYFPLEHHFEQQFHVDHRLKRHRAGRRMDYAEADADVLAEAIAQELAREVDYMPVETEGARRAAERIAELL
jgi:pimeloyl-ACP methyl ester carboxylesterase/predicted glycosyltransferase